MEDWRGCGVAAPPPATETDITETAHPDDLTARLAQGEPSAFTYVYERVADRLFGLGIRLLRDRGAAEDAVQHSFLELTRARPELESMRSVEAWLFKSMRFNCLDEIRRRERRPEIPTDQLPDPGSLDTIRFPDPDLEAALALLTPEQREVLHLKHVEGYDGEEIARITESNRSAVYAMAARAEARLRKLLDPVESDTEPTSFSVRERP